MISYQIDLVCRSRGSVLHFRGNAYGKWRRSGGINFWREVAKRRYRWSREGVQWINESDLLRIVSSCQFSGKKREHVYHTVSNVSHPQRLNTELNQRTRPESALFAVRILKMAKNFKKGKGKGTPKEPKLKRKKYISPQEVIYTFVTFSVDSALRCQLCFKVCNWQHAWLSSHCTSLDDFWWGFINQRAIANFHMCLRSLGQPSLFLLVLGVCLESHCHYQAYSSCLPFSLTQTLACVTQYCSHKHTLSMSVNFDVLGLVNSAHLKGTLIALHLEVNLLSTTHKTCSIRSFIGTTLELLQAEWAGFCSRANTLRWSMMKSDLCHHLDTGA